ncbi:alpha-D-ribose 1-methylphosphonate 5-triphosphate synthase subunit PhnH [Nitrobacteraceae bacterium AZCC 1564]
MTIATLQSGLGTGFANPVQSSQAVFRGVMNAMARPGSIHTIAEAVKAPSMMMPATAAVALALFDHDTPIWLDRDFAGEMDMASWLRFQTGAPLTADASQAAFALIAKGSALPDFETFAPGTPEYPDRSTTLVVQVETLTAGDPIALSGPGIQGTSSLRAGALPQDFVARMQSNRALFPLGVDLLLVSGNDLVALPRSAHVAAKEV